MKNTVKPELGGHRSSRSRLALGVMRDGRLRFREQLDYAGEKAASLGKIFPNVGGPKHCRRLFLGEIVRSILLYMLPGWAEPLANSQRRKQLNLVYRLGTLRVCSVFKATSERAILGVAGMILVDVLAQELNIWYHARRMGLGPKVRNRCARLGVVFRGCKS